MDNSSVTSSRNNLSIEHYIIECQQRIEGVMLDYLPRSDALPISRFYKAMRYSIFNGGKRLRPVLVYATSEVAEVDPKIADVIACVIELIHTYSLIHDDLPSMDNSNLRRGKPTCHIAFDEATAILVGDALQSLAFQILVEEKHIAITDQIRLEMLSMLTQAVGPEGMIAGQIIDLSIVDNQLSMQQLESMYMKKTGLLLQACINLVAMTNSTIDQEQRDLLDQYAKNIGLMFQLQDDVLDIEADTKILGKPQGIDQTHNKSTYPVFAGLEETKHRINELHSQALQALSDCQLNTQKLSDIATYILTRSY